MGRYRFLCSLVTDPGNQLLVYCIYYILNCKKTATSHCFLTRIKVAAVLVNLYNQYIHFLPRPSRLQGSLLLEIGKRFMFGTPCRPFPIALSVSRLRPLGNYTAICMQPDDIQWSHMLLNLCTKTDSHLTVKPFHRGV